MQRFKLNFLSVLSVVGLSVTYVLAMEVGFMAGSIAWIAWLLILMLWAAEIDKLDKKNSSI